MIGDLPKVITRLGPWRKSVSRTGEPSRSLPTKGSQVVLLMNPQTKDSTRNESKTTELLITPSSTNL